MANGKREPGVCQGQDGNIRFVENALRDLAFGSSMDVDDSDYEHNEEEQGPCDDPYKRGGLQMNAQAFQELGEGAHKASREGVKNKRIEN